MRTTRPTICFAATTMIAFSAGANPALYEVIGFDGFGPWSDGSPVLRADGAVALGGSNGLRLWRPGGTETALWSQGDPIHGLAPGRSVGNISFSSIDAAGNGAVVGEIRTGGPGGAFSSMFYGALINGELHAQAGGEGDILSGLVLPQYLSGQQDYFPGRAHSGTTAALALQPWEPEIIAFGPGRDAKLYSIPGETEPGGEGVFVGGNQASGVPAQPGVSGSFGVGADGRIVYTGSFLRDGIFTPETGIFVDDGSEHRMLVSTHVPASNGMTMARQSIPLAVSSTGDIAYFGLMEGPSHPGGNHGVWVFDDQGVERRASEGDFVAPGFGGATVIAAPGFSMYIAPAARFSDEGDIGVEGLAVYNNRSRQAAMFIGASGERSIMLMDQYLSDPGAEFDFTTEYGFVIAQDARSAVARGEVRYEGEEEGLLALVYAGLDGKPIVLARRGDFLDVGGGIEYEIWNIHAIDIISDQYVLADVMVNADGFESTIVMFTVPAPSTACLLLLALGASRRRR